MLVYITFKQVIMLFVIIFIGAFSAHLGAFSERSKSELSSLLINISVPFMIISSYMGERVETESLMNSFFYSIILFIIGLTIAFLAGFLTNKNNRKLCRFTMGFSNAAYMGFPLIKALFSDVGIVYASAFVTVFNILLWTVGIMFFSDVKREDVIRNLRSCPPIIAVFIGLVFFFTGIRLPDVFITPVSMIGDMTSPVSMLITGITIHETSFSGLIKRTELWISIVFRLTVIPFISMLLFRLLNFTGMESAVILIQEACPAAAISTVLAIRYGSDRTLASGIVAVSTFLSIITLPLFIYFLGIFGIIS